MTTARIGKFSALFFGLAALLITPAFAATTLRVIPSATEMSVDENLRLDFEIQTEGREEEDVGDPEYKAPDFEEVNSMSSRSSGTQITMGDGGFKVRRTETVTVILAPKKAGTAKITGLRVKVGDAYATAPDIAVSVENAPAKPKSNNYQSPYTRQDNNMQRGGPRPSTGGRVDDLVLRAEPNKIKAYKGEQVLLTFALYTRLGVQNIQVERYPNVPGFVKEEIQMPLHSGGISWNREVLDGKEYMRGVLAQYAIYPLKEGEQVIDPFRAKLLVRKKMAGMPGFDDEDSNFFGFGNLLQSLQPTVVTRASEPLKIQVEPLPSGAPAGFTGLVGDFEITAMADKYSVKMGEPLNIKVKVEGQGNASGIEKLNLNLPPAFDLYEDKSTSEFVRPGYSQKIFDYLLIPKEKGSFTIPSFEISSFDPRTRTYVTRKSEPIRIEVLEGTLGANYVAKNTNPSAQTAPKEDLRPWRDEITERKTSTQLPDVAYYGLLAVGSLLLVGSALFLGYEPTRKKNTKAEIYKLFDELSDTRDQKLFYARATHLIQTYLKLKFQLTPGSMTHVELKEELMRRGEKPEHIDEFIALLDQADQARFAQTTLSEESMKQVVTRLRSAVHES